MKFCWRARLQSRFPGKGLVTRSGKRGTATPAPPGSQSSGISRGCKRNPKRESFWDRRERSNQSRAKHNTDNYNNKNIHDQYDNHSHNESQ